MIPRMTTMTAFAMTVMIVSGCSTAPTSSFARSDLVEDAQKTVAMLKQNSNLDRFFNSSAGYAVYPTIAKGGFLIGGSHGRGALFENGRFTSYCDISQGTIGAQIGGQAFSQIIFFEDQNAVNVFKRGELEFAAQATAVAITSGASTNMDYEHGVAVFTDDQRGLMAEAAIGGQKFSVVSADAAQFANDFRKQSPNVYAFANEEDSQWGGSSEYSRSYNASQLQSVEGEIVSISEFTPARDAEKGRQITLRTNNAQVHTVHMGPVAYLDRANIPQLREGDRVTVNGSMISFQGQPVIIAREIVTSQRLELRDNSGRSVWDTRQDNSRKDSTQSQDQSPQSQQERGDVNRQQ